MKTWVFLLLVYVAAIEFVCILVLLAIAKLMAREINEGKQIMPVEIRNAPDALVPESSEGEVEFRQVEFSYSEERQILKDVNFTLKSGDCIAIVGPSGSGIESQLKSEAKSSRL